jgi:2-polyprenyl-3-methyl-5-hydroxy-6-metoxy-1,4-benzoquinol methylase
MNCVCCDSAKINHYLIDSVKYYYCNNCGCLFLLQYSAKETTNSLRDHYSYDDPHKKVSQSKTSFYDIVLEFLSSQINSKGKKILDIGCGYGYFLDMASKRGWEPSGIEVVQNAVKSSQEKVGFEKIFQGKLQEAKLTGDSFDAITLWDVLAIVDNPDDELKECMHLLKKGGLIGIRTRNVVFQKTIYRLFGPIRTIATRFGLKAPYVFNKYCFSGESLYALLSRLGYINIKIDNSPLTSGDPYNHMRFNYPVKLAKNCIDICSKLVFYVTRGRWLIAPSILIWAQKP